MFLVQEEFIWDMTHNAMIKKIFDHHRMARRLQQMMEDVRERYDHLTIWLSPDITKALYIHWETNKGFRCRCLMNRADRVSARSSKYISGSVNFHEDKGPAV
ncbi:hypothetical protein Ahy_B03g065442 isoform A [Arachis hypogaea]|uniref:Uncharacterized protein n=1 Tax=Arachis hypogaea TaxID=3818 RepID=A0A445A1S4_ARAHY|nr:hypothetical protein Ahy_B03g065442 isoform A [Arachis hypogaea]